MLGLSPARRKVIAADPRRFRIEPWHFHSHPRRKDENGQWRLQKLDSYSDSEGKIFSFPPPNANIQQFIETEVTPSVLARGSYDDTLPRWVRELANLQRSESTPPPLHRLSLLGLVWRGRIPGELLHLDGH